jgi:hypothetical protein
MATSSWTSGKIKIEKEGNVPNINSKNQNFVEVYTLLS